MKKKIQAFIFKKTPRGYEFLILKRGASLGNIWQPVTGTVEKGEDLLAAAKREVMEETGLKDFKKIHDLEHSVKFKNEFGEFEEFCYGFEIPSFIEDITISDEHEKYSWLNYETATEMLYWESNKEVLKMINKRINNGIN